MLVRRPGTDARRGERGQVLIYVVVMLGIFLLAATGIAVDLGNVWFHRQSAQTAADAACTAGVMDMLEVANGTLTPRPWWTTTTTNGTTVDCTTTTPNTAKTVPSPCWYAAKNGYASLGGTSGNTVQLTFISDGSSWGAKTKPGDPGFTLAGTAPFLRVNVVDRVQVYFLALLGSRTMNVPAIAGCGLQLAKAPVPIVILDPTNEGTLSGNGATGSINIIGGPTQSVQVNSGSQYGVAGQFNHTNTFTSAINLTRGGPSYSGSSLGLSGGPVTAPSGFTTNPPGGWFVAAPVSDPFSLVPTPPQPNAPVTPSDLASNPNCTPSNIQAGNCKVSYHDAVHGCPDTNGCTLYARGYYPNGIKVKGNETAVFDPGLYYLNRSFWLDALSTARPSTATGDNSGGTMFYLTGTPTGGSCKDLLCVDANSGIPRASITSSAADKFGIFGAQCPLPNGMPVDPNLITALNANGDTYTGLTGNLLLAPCSGTYGDPSGLAQYRGMLIFADRSAPVKGSYSGGGSSVLAGNVYFHQSDSFGSTLVLQGGSCSSSYILGEIVTDRMDLGGTPCVNMALNPSASYSILKAALMH